MLSSLLEFCVRLSSIWLVYFFLAHRTRLSDYYTLRLTYIFKSFLAFYRSVSCYQWLMAGFISLLHMLKSWFYHYITRSKGEISIFLIQQIFNDSYLFQWVQVWLRSSVKQVLLSIVVSSGFELVWDWWNVCTLADDTTVSVRRRRVYFTTSSIHWCISRHALDLSFVHLFFEFLLSSSESNVKTIQIG